MATYRNFKMSFWTDSKIAEDFSIRERYLFIYLLTNSHTNLCGCYEISKKQIAFETGMTMPEVRDTLKALQNSHKVICYSEETREVLLLNWYKHNWTNSEKFLKPLIEQIEDVKSKEYSQYLVSILNKFYEGIDTSQIPYRYPIDTLSIPVSSLVYSEEYTEENTEEGTEGKKETADAVKEIVAYLNEKAETNYKDTTKSTVENIRARMREGYTKEDFFEVIDKKCREWKDTEMEKHLTPTTLFRPTNFEKYKNQKIIERKSEPKKNFSTERDINMDELERKLYAAQGG